MSSFTTFTAPYEGVTRRRACGRCHSKKVRCEFLDGNGPCKNCAISGESCLVENRKRRTAKKRSVRALQRSKAPTFHSSVDAENVSTTIAESPLLSPRSLNPNDEGTETSLNQNHSTSSIYDATSPTPRPTSSATTTPSSQLRTASFVNRGAILPDSIVGLDKPLDPKESSMSEVDLKVLELYHAFDLPPYSVRQSLVDAFLDHCWTWMPVIDRDASMLESQSYLLQQALFLAGSQMRMNGARFASPVDYLRRFKALLDTNYEKDPITLVAALCIIQWWNPSGPNVVSTMKSRFWTYYAVNIAQQIGLHRKAPEGTPLIQLRKRLWWTLYVRDSLTSSAHGRPRIINLADCTVDSPHPNDFSLPDDQRATIFCSYVSICGILGDLCEMLSRNAILTPQERTTIGEKLLKWLQSLPESNRLYDSNTGYPNPYNFEVSKLHVIFFVTTMILFRSPSIYSCRPSCAPAIIASRMACHLFECFLVRDQARFLSGAEAWQLLVTAIPQLSCITVALLKDNAEIALDGLEDVLTVLARKLNAAKNNLKNVQLLRGALRKGAPQSAPNQPSNAIGPIGFDPILIFSELGGTAAKDYKQLLSLLQTSHDTTGFLPYSQEVPEIQPDLTGFDGGFNDADFNFSEDGVFADPFSGQTDWILDLMNGLSSWR